MDKFKKNPDKYIKAVFIALTVALVVLFALLVQQYLELRRQMMIDDHAIWLSFINRHAPLSATDVSIIQPWMTFDYVNRIFALPRAYLQTELGVNDARYPQLPIYRYAEADKIDTATLTEEIRTAVRNYSPAK